MADVPLGMSEILFFNARELHASSFTFPTVKNAPVFDIYMYSILDVQSPLPMQSRCKKAKKERKKTEKHSSGTRRE